MRGRLVLILALAASFSLGFAAKSLVQDNAESPLKRVTGIGGIFFKCKDPGKLKEWYKTHLGLNTDKYGAVFEWRQATDATRKGFSQWSPFNEKTSYFAPSEKEFMINYRVADLEALVTALQSEGVRIVDSVQSVEYGKFIHIMDIEGNKVELWEPNDIAYEKLGKTLGYKTTK